MKLDELLNSVGNEIGISDWIQIDQGRIDLFADATNDHQFIHVDAQKAAETPFGGTVAHGFLTLGLLSAMIETAIPPLEGQTMSVNYGFDKIRFLAPVRSGKSIRARFTVQKADVEKDRNKVKTVLGVTVEIEGEEKPALLAEWVTVAFFG